MGGLVSQTFASQAEIRARVPYVAFAKRAIHALYAGAAFAAYETAQHLEQLIQRCALTDCNVVDVVHRARIAGQGGEQICLDCIADEAEVPGGLAVTVDLDGRAGQHGVHPAGNHRGISALRVLAWAEYIEIAQADRLD